MLLKLVVISVPIVCFCTYVNYIPRWYDIIIFNKYSMELYIFYIIIKRDKINAEKLLNDPLILANFIDDIAHFFVRLFQYL